MTTEQLRRWQERFRTTSPDSVSVSVSEPARDTLPITSPTKHRPLEEIKTELLRALKESVAHTAATGELWSAHHARTIELIRERDRAAQVPNFQI